MDKKEQYDLYRKVSERINEEMESGRFRPASPTMESVLAWLLVETLINHLPLDESCPVCGDAMQNVKRFRWRIKEDREYADAYGEIMDFRERMRAEFPELAGTPPFKT